MLTPALVIQKKRDGHELSAEEIRGFISGMQTGEVADYQATAFLMAVYFRGMTLDETVALTKAMLESGERYDFSRIPGPKVDKHSTGGVGDKVSLVLAPLAAACGLKVPMMSGRGLGHTGGTLDKLESIPGFNVRMEREKIDEILRHVGCAMLGQSDKMVPADKKLYALRDVTGTVECIQLIVASILSKKLAEGTDALVLDVKSGNGAFMKSRSEARKLARMLTQVAKKSGLKCRAILTDMNQPLGCTAGNALEVVECIEGLTNHKILGNGDLSSGDLKELTVQLCAHMLELGGIAKNLAEGRVTAHSRLSDGSAWAKFQEMVFAQGGSLDAVNNTALLPSAPRKLPWKAKRRGYVTGINTESLGHLLVELGGGRKKISDAIDPGVGLVFHRKLGSQVKTGDTVVTVHAAENADQTAIFAALEKAFEFSRSRKRVPKLVIESMG